MPGYSYADPVVLTFVLLPLLLVGALARGAFIASRRSGRSVAAAGRSALSCIALSGIWMAVTWIAAASGVLREWDRFPPPFAFLVLGIVGLAMTLAFSGLGRRIATFIPLSALVGVQAFRLPLELAMHAMYERGIMPIQMSYSGRNFDIVTGVSAIVVSGLAARGRGGRSLVLVWNIIGSALLINIVVVAILATPAIRYFGDDSLNTWVTYPPFVWLPAVMVLAALAGHVVIFRALRSCH